MPPAEDSQSRMPITPEGHEALEAEIKHLKSVERPRIIQAIAEARAHGDLSENAEYHAAKEQQGRNESRVLQLEDHLRQAHIVDVRSLSGDDIKFGATVTLSEEETRQKRVYQIVGEFEADVKARKISINAPLARALIGKRKGDEVDVTTPTGARTYRIIKLRYT